MRRHASVAVLPPRLTSCLLRRADALPTLLDERDYGLVTSVLSFLQGLVASDSSRCMRTLAAHPPHLWRVLR